MCIYIFIFLFISIFKKYRISKLITFNFYIKINAKLKAYKITSINIYAYVEFLSKHHIYSYKHTYLYTDT